MEVTEDQVAATVAAATKVVAPKDMLEDHILEHLIPIILDMATEE